MIKKIGITLLILLVGIQFVRPAKNVSGDDTHHLQTRYDIPEDVAQILQVACYDCHSNKTTYPWYAEVQPSAWWLSSHVNEGKKHLNFSELGSKRAALQYHKLEETIEMVKEKEMPIPSYTLFGLHSEAKLSDTQRDRIVQWAEGILDQMKANYPADSLVLKRKK